jgi:lipoyl(octanoyl) transferase
MPPPQLRVLPFESAPGADNMAADEVLLRTAIGGRATLRFYAWSEATLSLGYFQPARVRQENPLLSRLPYVRRCSGGSALVHHFEVTYALALPAGKPWQGEQPWLGLMHEIIAEALGALGVPASLQASQRRAAPFQGTLCFKHLTAGDILVDAAKVVGSAQRKQRGALMQHGGVLLAKSPYAPVLPGIKDLCGLNIQDHELVAAIRKAFRSRTGWNLGFEGLNGKEMDLQRELKAAKYSQPSWNDKR